MDKSLYKGSMTNIMSLFHKSPRYQVVLCDCFEWCWSYIKDIINYIFVHVLVINILIYNIVHFFICWSSVFVRGGIACKDKFSIVISRLNGIILGAFCTQ